MPNASPLVVSKPRNPPSVGNTSAAMRLKKKMTEIDCATSSSEALMMGAVAAMAEPPQIDEPTPMSVADLPGTFAILQPTYATMSDVAIVVQMMGNDCRPVCAMTSRLRPNPRSTTAACRIFFDVNPMPLANGVLSLMTSVMTMPARMPKIGPPTMGTSLPSR